jgi:3-hydroxyisobutyrate dehydrogenase
MGRPMATNLLKAGHRVTGFDIDPAGIRSLSALGAAPAVSPRDAAAHADVVITMLPASPHVLAAMLGPDGVVEGLRPGITVIDMSTIDPGTTRKVAQAVAAKGGRMLDAPVSGSSSGARDATLTIMVGGDAAVLEEHRSLLETMGRHVIHCGPIGMGETVKLANNLIAAASMVAVAEAFALGVGCGADPQVLYDVISKSSGNCWALQRAPVPGLVPGAPVNDGFAPGFMVDLMHKDLGLMLAAAEEQRVPLPLTGLVRQLYSLASAQGHGREDMSAVARILGEVPAGPVATRA